MDTSSPSELMPDEVLVSRDRSTLTLCERDDRHALSAERLRHACRCAWCTRDRLVDAWSPSFAGIAIENVAPIGTHALHITFSDGHARGVFPFRYLREIANGEVVS